MNRAPAERTGPSRTRRRRPSALVLARAAFVVAAIGFGWWGLHVRGAQIVDALSRADPVRVLAALVLVVCGLLITGWIWRRILAGYGHPVPARPGAAIFFVGQLGKYIPGSVWSLGWQADMARAHRIPPRTTVAVGLLFLWVHVTSALPVAALLADLTVLGLPATWWTSGLAAMAGLAGLVGLVPRVLGAVGDRLAGAEEPLRLGWPDSASLAAAMAGVWLLYGAAATLVVPPDALAHGGGPALLLPITGAFALAYVVGVLVVLAPAGVGAREAVLVALLAAPLGIPVAVATALLIRLVHTLADFGVAAGSWALARRGA